MKTNTRIVAGTIFALAVCISTLRAQMIDQAGVPRLVNFSGKTSDVQGKPISGITGVTFAIYKGQYEGAPLWIETQNVAVDAKGNFTAQLGATKSAGLPLDLFSSGKARWLGVRVNGGGEQPRVLLLSVPYALKAADAETLGGVPLSAFVLAAPANGGVSVAANASAPGSGTAAAPPNAAVTGAGTVNAIPLWDTASDIVSSVMTQTGTGTTARIGINTTTPSSTLDVKGASTFRGSVGLSASGIATATAGKNSYPLNLTATAYNSGTATSVNQTFRWQAEPVGNNTSTPTGTLNLLYGSGSNQPAETGLKLSDKGLFTFAAGQKFPGTGSVTSVGLSAPSTDFTVSNTPVTGSGTLGLHWTVPPSSFNTANAIVKRDSAGSVSVGTLSATTANIRASGVGATAVNVISDNGYGITALTDSYPAIYGSSGSQYGVTGVSSDSYGVWGGSVNSVGVVGSGGTYGVYGSGYNYGVYATGGGSGVYASGSLYGLWSEIPDTGADAVHALAHGSASSALGALNDGGGDAIYAAVTNGGYAGVFIGDVLVDGNLSKAGGSFKIDHPLDPANKYLYHSFVESPDMMNVYNGNVTLDGNGEAIVPLPEWFQKLNRDFRYQLTCLDGFAPIFVAQRVQGNHFKIAGGKPGMEVSWQVTGIRQDAWANAHRIPVEQVKPDKERGFYLHPELFGAAEEKGIAWARHPGTMKKQKEPHPNKPPVGVRPLGASQ